MNMIHWFLLLGMQTNLIDSIKQVSLHFPNILSRHRNAKSSILTLVMHCINNLPPLHHVSYIHHHSFIGTTFQTIHRKSGPLTYKTTTSLSRRIKVRQLKKKACHKVRLFPLQFSLPLVNINPTYHSKQANGHSGSTFMWCACPSELRY